MAIVLATVGVIAAAVCRTVVWVSRSIDEACRFVGRMEP